MRSIYLNARRVVVWLGEEADAARALDVCRQWKVEGTKWGVDNVNGDDGFVPKLYNSTTASEQDYAACEALFSRPWWSRTWILQEVIHENPVCVLIGSMQLDLDDLIELYPIYQNAILFSRDHLERKVWLRPLDERIGFAPNQETWDGYLAGFDFGFNVIHNIGYLRKKLRDIERNSQSGLEILLHFFRHQRVTDPRDKIFAFLGMVMQRDTSSKVRADYSDSATKQTVYTNAARSMLGTPLHHVESPDRPIDPNGELPSWVPDFTTRRQAISTTMSTVSFSADSGLLPDVYRYADRQLRNPPPDQDRKFLRLLGICVGVIIGVVETHVSRHLAKMGESRIKLFVYNDDPNRDIETMDTRPWPSLGGNVNITNTSWGPVWTEEGDMVVVAVGYWLPVVLRPVEDHFLFVGVCWLIDSEIPEPGEFEKGTGFSQVMFGSACREVGKTKFLEEFLLH